MISMIRRTFGKIQIELNRNWKSMVKGLRDLKQLPLEDVPEGFHGNLRPYQQLGMSWLLFLRQYGFGATLPMIWDLEKQFN